MNLTVAPAESTLGHWVRCAEGTSSTHRSLSPSVPGMSAVHRIVALSILLGAVPIGGVALAQDAPKDTISARDGRRLRAVEVLEATTSVVRYKQRNAAAEIPSTLVTEIEWDGAPAGYAQGIAFVRAGDFVSASNQFLEAAGQTSRAPLKIECEFLAADALARGAGKDATRAQEAVAKLEAWISANADGFRLADAMFSLGGAQVAAGQSAEAEATYKKLADEAVARGLSPIWGARAKLGQARAQIARGDFGNARSTFRSAISAAQSVPVEGRSDVEILQIEADALVGTGDSLVREGKFDDALSYFRDEVGKRATNAAIKAAARAGEGEAILLKANQSGNLTADLRRAQIAFAEANLLDTVGGDPSSKALY